MIGFFTQSFHVHARNRSGSHWDVCDEDQRLYCIRGEEGRYTVYNEMDHSSDLKGTFRTVGACMAYICAELMTPEIPACPATQTG